MKTSGVKTLVRQVLDTLPTPYTEHVIDDVFHTIEHDPRFFERYNGLCLDLGKHVVNNWCGQWVAHALGKTGEQQIATRKSTLIGSYSLLDAVAKPVQRAPNEEKALELMSHYYRSNRETLPKDIRLHRDALIELIMAGVEPADAFAAVQLD